MNGLRPVPEVTSPAMKLLLAAIEKECKLLFSATKYLSAARIYMAVLDRLVNPTATMTEVQAATLADYIIDKWLPKNPDYTDALEPRMSMAAYINSCRA